MSEAYAEKIEEYVTGMKELQKCLTNDQFLTHLAKQINVAAEYQESLVEALNEKEARDTSFGAL